MPNEAPTDITPTTPSVIPAQPAATATKYWAQQIVISAPAVNGEADAVIILRAYDPATGRLAPVPPKRVVIENLFAKAAARASANDLSLVQTIQALMGAIDSIAKEQGDI